MQKRVIKLKQSQRTLLTTRSEYKFKSISLLFREIISSRNALNYAQEGFINFICNMNFISESRDE